VRLGDLTTGDRLASERDLAEMMQISSATLSKSDLRLEEVAGVPEARRLLEPRVGQLAAAHARDEDFADLKRVLEAQKRVLAEG